MSSTLLFDPSWRLEATMIFNLKKQRRVDPEEPNVIQYFKTEGGEKNVIELAIALKNGTGEIVTSHKPFPLEVDLVFENLEQKVPDTATTEEAPITKHPETTMLTQGRATVIIRVKSVSRSHNSRRFAIRVATTAGTHGSSNPLMCVAQDSTGLKLLCVRSKISWRRSKGVKRSRETPKTCGPDAEKSYTGAFRIIQLEKEVQSMKFQMIDLQRRLAILEGRASNDAEERSGHSSQREPPSPTPLLSPAKSIEHNPYHAPSASQRGGGGGSVGFSLSDLAAIATKRREV